MSSGEAKALNSIGGSNSRANDTPVGYSMHAVGDLVSGDGNMHNERAYAFNAHRIDILLRRLEPDWRLRRGFSRSIAADSIRTLRLFRLTSGRQSDTLVSGTTRLSQTGFV